LENVNEVWMNLKNNDMYQISNQGRLWSVRQQRIIKSYLKGNNRIGVNIYSQNGKRVFESIHRLVALVFVSNPLCKPIVHHINCNPHDNSASNLLWCTHDEHVNLHRNLPISTRKKESSLRKPISQFNKQGDFIKDWNSATDIENELGIKQYLISRCCTGKRKTTNKFIWKFK